MALDKYLKISLLILSISIALLMTACQKISTTTAEIDHNSDLYNFCIQNNGTILGSNPLQCNYQGLIYFQTTDNAINLQFCTLYYDGCNVCIINNGSSTGCTKISCEKNEGTPKCLSYNETPAQAGNIISVNFTCNQGDINVIFDNINHIANLTYNNKTIELAQVVSASGGKYSNQKITLYTHGTETYVSYAVNESKMILENCSSI